MEPREIAKLVPGSSVWIWIVRFGKGRWWPGEVLSLKVRQGIPLITVRFQAAAPEGRRAHAGIFAGISTTRMRFLEPREVEGKGGDRPRHPPVAILRVPELPLGTLAALTTAHSTFS